MPSPFQDLQVLSALYCDSRERGLPLFPDTHPTVSEVPMMKSFRFALALVFSLTVPALGGAQEPVSGIVARSASMSKDQPKDDGLLEQPSGLDVDDVSLTDALARLRQTAGVAVAYSPSLIPSDLTVSCPCGSLSVGEAMRTMLAGTGFEFSVVADHLVVRERSASPRLYLDGLQAPASPDMETIRVETSLGSYRPAVQEGRITGRVLDARTNSPVSEAQVFIPGTGIGMLTPEGGRYLLLSVPVGTHTLRVERIGYTSQEAVVTVEEDALVQQDFRLESEAVGLDEIIVTGTAGAARRREIGNTVGQIRMDETLGSPQKVDELLKATIPGMTSLTPTASLGSAAQIRLRGNVSATQSNQPVIYVDGIRIRSKAFAENNTLAEGRDDRGNNDNLSALNSIDPADIERIEVIKGAAATTLYGTEASAGVIQVFTKRGREGPPRWTMNIEQGVAYTLPFGVDASRRPPSEPAATASGATSDFMFFDPWLQTAHRQKYNLSVSGGTEDIQYFLSGSWVDNEGTLPNDAEEKVSIRGNLSFSPLEDLTVQWNTSYLHGDWNHTSVGNNSHGITLNAFRRDRNYRGSEKKAVLDSLLAFKLDTELDHVITSLEAVHTPFSRLTQKLNVGWDLAHQNTRNFRPFGFVQLSEGAIQDARHRFSTVSVDYVGTLSFGLADDLSSDFSFGGQLISEEELNTGGFGRGFPGPGEPTVDDAGTSLGFEDRERVVNGGFFFQNMFDLRDRYFLTAGVRVDGNSAFGENFGLEAYPKVSGSWVLSDEDFWDPGWGTLRVRGAWGQSGRAPGPFDATRTFAAVGWGDSPAFLPANVGNPDLGPEVTSEVEGGFEGSFLNDRLVTDFTYFYQKTKDALFNVRQVPSQGFLSPQLDNIGQITNKGIELSISGVPVRTNRFSWEVGGSLATNDNEVTDLGGAAPFSLGNFGWIVEGESAPVIRANCVTNPGEKADPVIETDCNIGPNQPTHIVQGFMNFHLPADVQLSVRGEFQGGNYIFDGASWNAVRRGVRWPGCFDAQRILETQGREEMTALQRAQCLPEFWQADFFIYPADFFKLRTISLSVPVPQRLIGSGRSATFSITAQDVFKWVNDDFRVLDPEAATGDEGFEAPVRYMLENIPAPAVVTAALRVTF